MSRIFLHNAVALLLPALLAATATVEAQPGPHKNPASALVTVQAPLMEMLKGYLRWERRHPEVTPAAPPRISGAPDTLARGERGMAGTTLMVLIPSVDLYSASGVSIFHGSDSQKNAEFINALPGGIPRAERKETSDFRPTLQEAIEMFTELKPYEHGILARGTYVVFAFTYRNDPKCRAQNDAIRRLETRAAREDIAVVEVRLLKPE